MNTSSTSAVSNNFSLVSPTVKIISFRYTKNKDLVAESSGSATIIDPRGIILTNNHVVVNNKDESHDIFKICLSFKNQEKPVCEYAASLISQNEELDLALLQIHDKDFHGNEISNFPFLSFSEKADIETGSPIFVHGYPDTGGKTITITQGEISGFEKVNTINYIKTDTEISSGNSGGTALNKKGELIGIPTYVLSSIGTLAYVLDIREAYTWIQENIDLPSTIDEKKLEILGEKTLLFNDAVESKSYKHPRYPYFALSLDKDWEFTNIERSTISIERKKNNNNLGFSININYFPFTLEEDFIKKSLEKTKKEEAEFYENYKQEEIMFAEQKAYKTSFNSYDYKNVKILIPYGYASINIQYRYELKKEKEVEAVFNNMLSQIVFEKKAENPQELFKLERLENPKFSIQTTKNWYLQENAFGSYDNLIAYFLRKESIESKIAIYHMDLSEGDKQKTEKEILKEVIDNAKYVPSFRLVNKNDNIVISDIPGISVSYNYQGKSYNETRKKSQIFLFEEDSYYLIEYDDLLEDYDLYLGDFKNILKTFSTKIGGKYSIGSLNYTFFDISYHRYESHISSLKEKGIIEGFRDNTFHPEQKIQRAEALKIILEAKKYIDTESEIHEDLSSLQSFHNRSLDFLDTRHLTQFFPYIRYAKKNEIVKGYPNGNFYPEVNIPLAEGIKILLKTFDIPIWESETPFPWYKSYMDKAFETGLIPNGLYFYDHPLTRGEFCYIVSTLLKNIEEKNFYF